MTNFAKYDYPEHLVQIMTGGLNQAIFEIAIDLDIFNKIDKKDLSLKEFSDLFRIPLSSSRVFIQYLCMLGLLKYTNGKFYNSPLTQEYLVDRDVAWLKDLLAVSRDKRDGLKSKILNPKSQDWYKIRDKKQKIGETFFKGWLYERRVFWGKELAKQYDFSEHRTLLDVGGACGGWCLGIRTVFPHLKCLVFDIPQVCRLAESMMEKTEMVRMVPGSFFENDFPQGADIVLLANVLHDWSPADGRKILSKIHNAMPSQGKLLLSEFYFNDDFSGPAWAGLQAFCVLGTQQQSGWQPTYEEASQMLSEEKFKILGQKENLIIAQK